MWNYNIKSEIKNNNHAAKYAKKPQGSGFLSGGSNRDELGYYFGCLYLNCLYSRATDAHDLPCSKFHAASSDK